MQKIGFIGFGLIGGSLAKIWKKKHPDYVLVAYNYRGKVSEELITAKEDGVLTDIATNISELSDCDVILLSAPVMSNIGYLRELKAVVKKDCIITDAGSVKGGITAEAKRLGMDEIFIGGHPMAGSEKTGYANATLTLFENAYYIITPFSHTEKWKIEKLRGLIQDTKALPIEMDAEKHDCVTAAVSHVPHLIASSLVGIVAKADGDSGLFSMLAAGGFRDTTRIASSSPQMWRDICLSNKSNITVFLDNYIKELQNIKTVIENDEERGLYEFFENNKNFRDSMPLRKSNMALIHEILLYVPDEPGEIAILASILGAKGISIKNIGIAHNREFSDGVLRIEFYDNFSREAGLKAIRDKNYKIYE